MESTAAAQQPRQVNQYMCFRDTWVNKANTRFRPGEPFKDYSKPNKHFMEINHHELSMPFSEILIDRLVAMGKLQQGEGYDWDDDSLVRAYGAAIGEKQVDPAQMRKELYAHGQKIGAPVHHNHGVHKLNTIITAREAEINAEKVKANGGI